MEYTEKIVWLRRYRDGQRSQRELEAELKEQQEETCRVTLLLSFPFRDGGEEVRNQQILQSMWDVQRRLVNQIEECTAIRHEVEKLINQVEDPLDRDILRRRYLLGQQWKQIAKSIPMDFRNVTKRHRRAVEQLPL